MQSVLFVCVGNICRSPCLEAVLQAFVIEAGLQKEIFVDSCAISSYHVGCEANVHMVKIAREGGFKILHRAKLFEPVFLDAFDYIFAVDHEVKSVLLGHSSKENRHKIYLVTAFGKEYHEQEMPDPYYGGESGFKQVLAMARECCLCILEHLRSKRAP